MAKIQHFAAPARVKAPPLSFAARTGDLLFKPAAIVAYVSQFTTLRPGDLIATGTPGGVGAGRDPKVFLAPGQLLETAIEGIGACRNLMVEDKA